MAAVKTGILSVSFVLLILSLAINVLQARYIGLMLDRSEQPTVTRSLPVGAHVPSIDLVDLTGKPARIEYNAVAKPTLLYVFRPSCVWCQKNASTLERLTEKVSDRYRIVGLSLTSDGLEDFVRSHAMNFSVYTGLSQSTISTYQLGTTPQTLVISQDGAVRETWSGAYIGGTKTAIEKYFAINLKSPISEAN